MTVANWVMEWPRFVRALEEKRGTLIEEWAPFKVEGGPVQGWWTSDDVLKASPYSVPEDGMKAIRDKEFGPFNSWCREEYTGAQGKALLVWGDEMERPMKEVETKIAIPVVTTLFHKGSVSSFCQAPKP